MFCNAFELIQVMAHLHISNYVCQSQSTKKVNWFTDHITVSVFKCAEVPGIGVLKKQITKVGASKILFSHDIMHVYTSLNRNLVSSSFYQFFFFYIKSSEKKDLKNNINNKLFFLLSREEKYVRGKRARSFQLEMISGVVGWLKKVVVCVTLHRRIISISSILTIYKLSKSIKFHLFWNRAICSLLNNNDSANIIDKHWVSMNELSI